MMAVVESGLVWHNGKIIDWKETKVHISTWSLHYSVAMFEGIRCYEGLWKGKSNALIFRLGEHVERFLNSAKIYEMPLEYSAEQIEKAIVEIAKKNELKNGYIRPLLYFGKWKSPAPTKRQLSTDLTIFTSKMNGANLESWKEGGGIRCMFSSWRKPQPDSLPADAKCSANYATSYLAALDAESAGYDYALLLDHRGFVSEGLASNLFAVFNGKLLTPPTSASILKGITRDSIMELAKGLGIRAEEQDIMPSELLRADEVFVTGTASGVMPVIEIDKVKVGEGREGEITGKLRQAYGEVVVGKNEKYRQWLTPIY
ncbi:branched chain amino acid aminotransferase [Candidatus Micrarchaeota archaeon]|nr:MAG: branched chain amino acid aminotransferase [Candidatus Micrarchaeota archaeon]